MSDEDEAKRADIREMSLAIIESMELQEEALRQQVEALINLERRACESAKPLIRARIDVASFERHLMHARIAAGRIVL